MSNQQSCACGSGPRLIFACSGAADVGEIADRAARKLTRDGAGRMFCAAGLGGRISGILKTTEAAVALAVAGAAAISAGTLYILAARADARAAEQPTMAEPPPKVTVMPTLDGVVLSGSF